MDFHIKIDHLLRYFYEHTIQFFCKLNISVSNDLLNLILQVSTADVICTFLKASRDLTNELVRFMIKLHMICYKCHFSKSNAHVK